MTDREKLYELIDSVDIMNIPTENFRHSLADYLLSNGVVVRDRGEWVDCSPYMGHYCSRCGRITGNAILYDGTLISKFCDNCGADMRGGHGN